MNCDPRIDKLVEALDRLWQLPHDPDQRQIMEEMYESASTPLKEFAGLTKLEWHKLAAVLDSHDYPAEKQASACRKISEGLSE